MDSQGVLFNVDASLPQHGLVVGKVEAVLHLHLHLHQLQAVIQLLVL